MFKKALEKSIVSFQKVLFPDKCSACGEFFDRGKTFSLDKLCEYELIEAYRHILSEVLCEKCLKDFVPVEEPYCNICGGMFKSRTGISHICHRCHKDKSKGRIRSMGVYDGSLLELIHKLKYNLRTYLALVLGKLLFIRMLGMTEAYGFDIVIPVPLFKKKMRKRGFNQSILMVKEWDKYFDSFGIKTRVDFDAVLRIKNTETQIGLSSKERDENLKNAFLANERVMGKRILIVDDVYTTGATVSSMKKALYKKKAELVDVITVARTGDYIN